MGIKDFVHNKVMLAKTGLDIDWAERERKMKTHIEGMRVDAEKRNKDKIVFLETKEAIIVKLELLRKRINSHFQHDIDKYCKKEKGQKCDSCDVFFILKFAQQHPILCHVLNYNALHETRQFRNRMAHPDEEYKVEDIEILNRYKMILENEIVKLNIFLSLH